MLVTYNSVLYDEQPAPGVLGFALRRISDSYVCAAHILRSAGLDGFRLTEVILKEILVEIPTYCDIVGEELWNAW